MKNLTKIDIKKLIGINKISFGFKDNPNLEETLDFLVDFFNGNNKQGKVYTFSEAKSLLYQAKNASILMADSTSYVVVKDIADTLEKIDIDTIDKLSSIYRKFFKSFDFERVLGYDKKGNPIKETKDMGNSINDVFSRILKKGSDSCVQEINASVIKKLQDTLFVYTTLKPYLPQAEYDEKTDTVIRHADGVIKKVVSTKALETYDPRTLKEVVETLTSEILGKDKMSPEELSQLLKHTSIILRDSSQSKILKCQEVLNKYANYLLGKTQDQEFSDMIKENINLKKIALQSGSILKTSEENQESNFKIMTGETLGNVFREIDNLSAEEMKIIEKYSNVKVESSNKGLYRLLTTNSSTIMYRMSPYKILEIAEFFDKIKTKMFEENKQGRRFRENDFRIEDFITTENLVQLMNFMNVQTDDNMESDIDNIIANIKSLNKYMNSKNIFKVMRNNINLFLVDNNVIQFQLDNILTDTKGDTDILKVKINEFVNNGFSIGSGKATVGGKRDKKEKDDQSDMIDAIPQLPTEYPAFTVDIDVRLESNKLETFKERLNKLSIEDCFEVLSLNIDSLETIDQNPGVAISIDTVRVLVYRCKQIIDRMYDLINEIRKEKPYDADQYMNAITEIKHNRLHKIVSNCKTYLKLVQSVYNKIKRGKETHVNPTDEKSYTVSFGRVREFAENMPNENMKKMMLQDYIERKKQFKAEIKQENIDANRERIAKYNESMQENDNYAIISVLADSLERIL